MASREPSWVKDQLSFQREFLGRALIARSLLLYGMANNASAEGD
jgi:hypothetical protein